MADENEPGRFLWLRSTAKRLQPDPFLDRQFQYIQSSLEPVNGVNDPVLIDIHDIDGVGGRSGFTAVGLPSSIESHPMDHDSVSC